MEIQELIFFYLHENINTVEVHFRLNIDSEEEMRTDFISLNEASDFGYEIIKIKKKIKLKHNQLMTIII